MKTVRYSPKPAPIVDEKTVLSILKNVRSKKETHSDTEYILFYLSTDLFTTNLLLYIALYVGYLSPCLCQRRPFAYLCNFCCCQFVCHKFKFSLKELAALYGRPYRT
jgi:hypothetical protein